MIDVDKQIKELIDAWILAGKKLGIRVIAPFEYRTSEESHKCIAYLPDFGGPKGMFLQATFSPNFATDKRLASDAENAGYYMSFINPNSYARFDLQEFQDALKDWGFHGPVELCPAWMETAHTAGKA